MVDTSIPIATVNCLTISKMILQCEWEKLNIKKWQLLSTPYFPMTVCNLDLEALIARGTESSIMKFLKIAIHTLNDEPQGCMNCLYILITSKIANYPCTYFWQFILYLWHILYKIYFSNRESGLV